MLIADVETFVLKLEADQPYLGRSMDRPPNGSSYAVRPPWRSLYSTRYETVLVRVIADDGMEGWGEALAPVGPEVPAAIVDRLLAPALRGMDAAQPRPTWYRLRDLMRERGHLVGHQADALAAVDIALWDLAGRQADRSVASLLGGAFRAHVPTYVSGLPAPTDDERADLARQWEDRGASAVKLHLGNGVKADLATFDAIRKAAPSIQIAVDAHWAYSTAEALRLAHGLTERGGWFLEAPLAPEDLDGHAALQVNSGIPVAVGESLRNRYEFGAWLGARALQIAQPDVARTGITEAMAVGELCSSHHVRVAPHHSVGLGVSQAAGVHLAAALENLLVFEYQPTSTDVGARILAEPLDVTPARIAVPSGPGLGIRVDADAVHKIAKES